MARGDPDGSGSLHADAREARLLSGAGGFGGPGRDRVPRER